MAGAGGWHHRRLVRGVRRARVGPLRTWPAADGPDDGELLDRFVPEYEGAGPHRLRVRAPAAIALAAAREMDLFDSPLVHGLFRARELIVGSTRENRPRRRGLLAEAQSLGWGMLAEAPGREVIVGAITRPWESDVTFATSSPCPPTPGRRRNGPCPSTPRDARPTRA
jgi:hypothetical protein